MLKGCKPLYQVWGAFCELSLSWTKSTDETWIDIDPLKPAPWLLKKWILKLFMLGSGPCISENKYGSNPFARFKFSYLVSSLFKTLA